VHPKSPPNEKLLGNDRLQQPLYGYAKPEWETIRDTSIKAALDFCGIKAAIFIALILDNQQENWLRDDHGGVEAISKSPL